MKQAWFGPVLKDPLEKVVLDFEQVVLDLKLGKQALFGTNCALLNYAAAVWKF